MGTNKDRKKSGKTRIRRYAPICVIFVLAFVASFTPGLLSFGWYVLHKHEVSFAGVSLTIPRGWELNSSTSNDIVLLKRSAFLFGDQYYERMRFSLIPSAWEPASTTYGQWKVFVTSTYTQSLYAQVQERQVGADHGQSFCVSALFRTSPSLERADCVLLRNEMRAEFNGRTSDVDEFFAVVGGVRRAGPPFLVKPEP